MLKRSRFSKGIDTTVQFWQKTRIPDYHRIEQAIVNTEYQWSIRLRRKTIELGHYVMAGSISFSGNIFCISLKQTLSLLGLHGKGCCETYTYRSRTFQFCALISRWDQSVPPICHEARTVIVGAHTCSPCTRPEG